MRIVLCALTLVYCYACVQEPLAITKTSPTEMLTLQGVGPSISEFPLGTTYKIEGNRATWTLPTGYIAITNGDDGTVKRAGSGTITCTCIQGKGGCSPILFDSGKLACLQEDCETCNKTVESIGGGFLEDVAVCHLSPIKAVGELSEVSTLRLAPVYVLELDTFVSALTNFVASLPPPSSTSATETVLLDVWGLLMPVDVPAGALPNALRIGAGNASCSCKSGDGGCTLERVDGATICVAGDCNSCSLTFDAIAPGGEVERFTFDSRGYPE